MVELIALVKQFQKAPTLEERLACADAIISEVGSQLMPFILNQVKSAGRPELAEDVFQETLVRIAQRMDSFRGINTREFWGWCYQLARRLLIDLLRSPRFREYQSLELTDLETALEHARGQNSLNQEDREDLDYALHLLRVSKPACVELLMQHYILDWDYADLGNALGISPNVARMRINRCLERAQQLVREEKV